jgi:hypothetical protein
LFIDEENIDLPISMEAIGKKTISIRAEDLVSTLHNRFHDIIDQQQIDLNTFKESARF